MRVRTKAVMVKIAPGHASPEQVRFSPEELERVVEMVATCGYDHVSTWIKDVGLAAAKATITDGVDAYDTIKRAADECAMPLGGWLRTVCLGAASGDPLRAHMEAARKTVEALQR